MQGAGSAELKSELKKLRALLRNTQEEKVRLEEKLQARQADDFFINELGEDALRTQVKELKRKLSEKEESFQKEIAAVQAMHQQELEYFQNTHKDMVSASAREPANITELSEEERGEATRWEQRIKQIEERAALQSQLLETKAEQLERDLLETREKYDRLASSAKSQLEKATKDSAVVLKAMETQHEEELLQELEAQDQLKEDLKKLDRKSTRLNSSHRNTSRMPSSA